MSVKGRVIAGKYRNKPLVLLFDQNTRSTKERVKEAMFSALNEEVKHKVVLDLFAGSGALGIEALSRGANEAFFCEKNKVTYRVLEHNLSFVEERPTLFQDDYANVLNLLPKNHIDIIIIDPPYGKEIRTIIAEIYTSGILKKDYLLVVETEQEFTDELKNVILKKYKYGRTHLTIMRGRL